ncbi:MAG: endonuclease [Bacteroidota bacterium]
MKFLAHILVGLISLQYAVAGTIVTSVSTLPSFGNVYPYNSSTSLKYTVSGTSLTAPLIISSSPAFEVSLTYGYGYTGSITINPTSGTVSSTVVYVRFSPSVVATYASASNSVTNASVGSTTVSVTVSGTCIATTVPSGASAYYNTIGNVRGAGLKTALYGKVSVGTTAVGYTPGVWNAYATTDVQPNGKVWDIYSARFDVNSPYEYTLSTNQCGNYSLEGDCYNREHSFPQSWFNSSTPMVSELNHVFASDGKVNGMRNNYPYGNVTTATYTSAYGGKLGTSTANNFGYTGTVFEPIDEYKGDLARGYFFMATRYENLIAGWSTNGNAGDILAGNSFPAFLPWQLSLLLSWNNLDPVSDKEIKRNNAVAALQGNRNPFIDSPQYVQRIWGGSIAPEPTISSSNLTYTHNGTNTANLYWKSGNGNRRIVIAKAGSAVNSFPTDTFAYTANGAFASGTNLGNSCYVVYNGTGSSCTITGLNNITNYYMAVIEYNGISNITNYNTTTFLASAQVTLPVKWLGFQASLYTDESVLLNWQTATEQNNAWFETERSTDMVNWLSVDKQKGAGTSNRINTYNSIDNIAALTNTENIYYRIKQTDVNGNYTYSDVKQVTINNNQNITVQVSPNPFHNTLGLNITLPTPQTVKIAIKNGLGITVAIFEKEVNTDNQYIQMDDLQSLPSGLYMVQIEHSFGTQIVKCVKN